MSANELDQLDLVITALNQALPLIIDPTKTKDAITSVMEACDLLESLTASQYMNTLATAMKIIAASGSPLVQTATFQAYILDVLELLTQARDEIANGSAVPEDEIIKLTYAGEFIIRLSGRLTNRYKVNIVFDPEYEAKSIRAFMVLKELSTVVRFLNISPDLSDKTNANLDNGMEVEVLSQATPQELHRLASSVLQVKAVQIFTETANQATYLLDPPKTAESYDDKILSFLGS